MIYRKKMIFECKDIKKSYSIKGEDKVKVLKGISLELYENDFIAMMGASGAGKSTLLHILAGLERADEGEILFNNSVRIDTLNDVQISNFRNRHVGFVFQAHHLLPEFTALENIMMPAMIAGDLKKDAKKKAASLIERVNLSDRANHKPDELSGGEQQRITIARALINNPTILFADEPTGNLDEENADMIIDLIDDLRKEFRLTCLIATHNSEIAARADKLIKLKAGKIKV
jgi:ABC-type lipoprotein export system ATPase subunit